MNKLLLQIEEWDTHMPAVINVLVFLFTATTSINLTKLKIMEQEQNKTEETTTETKPFKARLFGWLRTHLKAITELILQYLFRKK